MTTPGAWPMACHAGLRPAAACQLRDDRFQRAVCRNVVTSMPQVPGSQPAVAFVTVRPFAHAEVSRYAQAVRLQLLVPPVPP